MYLKKIRVLNYKCFEDSGWVEFGEKFNIVIGQNNSGKTAFLEVLDRSRFGDKPHRNVKQAPGSAVNPTSETQIIVSFAGEEKSTTH
jgi:AAA15 family ATPase/GTPase